MNDAPAPFPNATPGDDEIVVDADANAAFVREAREVAEQEAERLNWTLGGSLLTQNEKFGLIWRIDFVARDLALPGGEVFRWICWGTADPEIIGTVADFKGVRPFPE